MLRAAAVAGRFYPGQPAELAKEIDGYNRVDVGPETVIACVVPHAGIMYSGHVAGAVFGRLSLPPTAIIFGPNHAGRGSPCALQLEGEWETPLGRAPVDAELAGALQAAFPALQDDPVAHRWEHSIEVQVPFLQRLRPDIQIVPLALSVGRYETVEELGRVVARVITERSPRPLLVASTDLNHYEAESVGRTKDRMAIDAILKLDPGELYETIRRERISMCGYEPTISALTAARALGAREAELIRYATSGDITGDRSSVVGYAGIVVR